MTLKQQLKFWVIALVAFVLFLVLLSNILLPFVLGMGVAYFLDPVADRLEEKGMSRTAATALIIGMFLILVNIALILIVPILIEQVLGFMDNVPEYYENIRNFLLPIIDRFVDLPAWRQNEEFNDTVGQYIGEMAKKLALPSSI